MTWASGCAAPLVGPFQPRICKSSQTVVCLTHGFTQQPCVAQHVRRCSQAATITVDGGYKAFASDSVSPVCDALPDMQFRFAGDEHGVLILPFAEDVGQNEAPPVQLGQVLEFAVPHCDPTVNLHDQYWIREADGMVHSIWPISARGCSW